MMHYQQRQSSMFLRSSSSASTLSSYPVVLSVFAWSVTLLLIFSCLDVADAGGLTDHRLGKRSFALQCKGRYDASIFARLNHICDDCFNIYHEPQVYTLCMENCFTSDNFKNCLDALSMQDKIPEIQQWVIQIHGIHAPVQ